MLSVASAADSGLPQHNPVQRSGRQPSDVRRQFLAAGISIRGWAEERGYPPHLVYAALNGRLKGQRGLAHQVMIDLGLKSAPSGDVLDFFAAAATAGAGVE